MINKPFTVLSIAVASGKVGYVFLVDGELMDWGLSVKASKDPDFAYEKTKLWFNFYTPDIIITEQIPKYFRKSKHTEMIISTIAEQAGKTDAQHIKAQREQQHKNKYEEIEALAKCYPQIAHEAPPKRRLWEPERRSTILFEALAMADQIIKG